MKKLKENWISCIERGQKYFKSNLVKHSTLVSESVLAIVGSARTSFSACLNPLLAWTNINLLLFSITILLTSFSVRSVRYVKNCSLRKPGLATITHLIILNRINLQIIILDLFSDFSQFLYLLFNKWRLFHFYLFIITGLFFHYINNKINGNNINKSSTTPHCFIFPNLCGYLISS